MKVSKTFKKTEQLRQQREEIQQQIIELLGHGWETVQEEFVRYLDLKAFTRNVSQVTSIQSVTDDTKRILINAEYQDYPLIHSLISDVLILPLSKMVNRLEQATHNSLDNLKMLTADSFDMYMELEGKKMGINTHLSKYKT